MRPILPWAALLLLSSCGDGSPYLFFPATTVEVEGPTEFQGTVGEPISSPPAVFVRDANGNPVPGVEVRFQVQAGGGRVSPGTVQTDVQGRAAPTRWTLGEKVGENRLVASVRDAGEVSFRAQAEPGPPTRLEPLSAQSQEGTVGMPVPQPPVVRVEDEFGNPISGVEVQFQPEPGAGSVEGSPSTSDVDGVAGVTTWTLGEEEGIQSLVARVQDGPALTFIASTGAPGEESFRIELRYVGGAPPAVRRAFTEAVSRWEELITGNLPPVPMDLEPGECGPEAPPLNQVVDDVLIFVWVEPIDGSGGILAQAGPCWIRTENDLPIVGVVMVDEDDVAAMEIQGILQPVILHEIGHVLGIGTLWNRFGFLQNPSLPSALGADTHFDGPFAISAFDDIGGWRYTGGAKVPVENQEGGQGSRDSHWRQSVFSNELMTPFISQGPNPLSRVTVASLQDLGYEVDLDRADPFAILGGVRLPVRAPMHSLGDHVYDGPIGRLDPEGRPVGRFR